MTTDTHILHIVDAYTTWPLLCWNCGSDKVVYSSHVNDSLCQCCNEWQLNEEEE